MTTEITFTPSQAVGADKIDKFLRSPHRIFRLIGPAGYGKTTLIKYALRQQLEKDYIERGHGLLPNVLGVALAHKAKTVLGGSIMHVASFASAYGFREKIHDNGTRTFEPLSFYAEPPLAHQPIPILVCDEISMFSQNMIDIMLENTPSSTKIILMGDQAQLPPVKDTFDKSPADSDSPIFYMNLPEECHHELTEPVRQKEGNPILDLAYIIRKEIFGTQDVNKVISHVFNCGMVDDCGIEVLHRSEAIKQYVEHGDFLNNKIITYKNDTVKNFNTEIRNIVMNNPTKKLVNNDIIFLTNNFRSEDPEFALNNAEEFIVQNVSVNNFHILGFKIESYFAFIPSSRYNFPVFVLTPTEEGMKVYNKAIKELGDMAKHNRGMWKKFFAVKDSFTEYTMGYVINAYRSQGSTYHNVYFDVMDVLALHTKGILSNKRVLQTIYTIITRASRRVVFIKPD